LDWIEAKIGGCPSTGSTEYNIKQYYAMHMTLQIICKVYKVVPISQPLENGGPMTLLDEIFSAAIGGLFCLLARGRKVIAQSDFSSSQLSLWLQSLLFERRTTAVRPGTKKFRFYLGPFRLLSQTNENIISPPGGKLR